MSKVMQKPSLLASHAEVAYNAIEEMIVTLELAPGESLTEQALCARLEMGRTPVREALLRLKHDYLLAVLPRQGILIKPIDTTTALEALDVRHHVEGLLIERATRLASESQRAEFLNMASQAEHSLAIRDNILFSRIDISVSMNESVKLLIMTSLQEPSCPYMLFLGALASFWHRLLITNQPQRCNRILKLCNLLRLTMARGRWLRFQNYTI